MRIKCKNEGEIIIYKAQGKFALANEEAARAIEIAESAQQLSWKNWTLQALFTMNINSGELAKAKEIADKELKRLEEAKSPQDSNWIFHKTYVAAMMKSFEDAKKGLSEFKVLNEKEFQNTGSPKSIRYYDWLKGVIALEEKDLSGAIADLEKTRKQYEAITRLSAGRMYSGDLYARSFYMLGKIYEQQGKKQRARENHRKFLDLWKNADPDRPEPADARKRLVGLT